VYLEIYRDPLMSVSDKSFVGELIEIAGGNNVFDTLERDYSRVNPETVIAAKPDIMICFSQDNLPNILSRKGWQVIPALQDSMIFFEDSIDPDLIQRAGPRIIEGIMALEKIYEHWRTSTP
ncbi:MAG: ABC transporter substrate-binding protein, partial [Candidatus Cloacimonadaceae bacterium]|nr:ABC transporter substrate-binding protein [Candidatus Cloacimonadota bacterium]